MGLVVHCPACEAQLTVALSAAGRMGRCPQCKSAFRVPTQDELVDDTIGTWLEHEVAQEDDDDIPPPPVGRKLGPPPAGEARLIPRKPIAPPSDPDSKAQTDAAPAVAITNDAKPVYAVRSAIRHGVTADVSPTASESTAPRQPERSTMREAPLDGGPPDSVNDESDDSDAEPHATLDRLHIVEVNAAGVRLEFHSNLLLVPAFRASMPFCCVLCGEQEDRKLIARPLPWLDHAGDVAKAGEIETLFAVHVKAHQAPREVLDHVQTLDHLNAPFNEPIIYFVCQHCANHVTIPSRSYTLPTGVHCEVIIPSGRYALEWLGRVNGIIGEDYQRLESQVSKLDSDAWRAVPEQVRARINAWFDFEGDEHFVAYFSDSDFPKKDAGLAGIVLTEKRMVYCKFSHKGAIPLDAQGELVIVPEGPFCSLAYQRDRQHHRKLVRLRTDHTQHLLNLMEEVGATLAVVEAEPTRSE